MASRLKPVLETTRYDIIRGASPEPWKDPMSVRIQGYTLRLASVEVSAEDKTCIVRFTTGKSGHTLQDVYVSLEDFWEMYDANESSDKKMSLASLLNLVIMHGDLKIYCTCPSWIYGGYKYMATQLDYAYQSTEDRFPKIRNPHLMGTVCKHVYVVLKALPYQKFGIQAAIKKELDKLPKEKETSDNSSNTSVSTSDTTTSSNSTDKEGN